MLFGSFWNMLENYFLRLDVFSFWDVVVWVSVFGFWNLFFWLLDLFGIFRETYFL